MDTNSFHDAAKAIELAKFKALRSSFLVEQRFFRKVNPVLVTSNATREPIKSISKNQ
jgi:hypothetical protein